MCANLFIFSLSETGVVCSHFEDVSKMKSGQMFSDIFYKVMCTFFVKLRQGGGGGACGNFKVVSPRQTFCKVYFAQIPKHYNCYRNLRQSNVSLRIWGHIHIM